MARSLLSKHLQQIRVIYADTDALGIVYHTNYIKWFEIGRTEMLRDLRLIYSEMESFDFNLPLSKVFCHYFIPARFDDVLIVETEIDYIRSASLRFIYSIWDSGLLNKYAEGYTVHACANRNGKIAMFPDTFSKTIKE